MTRNPGTPALLIALLLLAFTPGAGAYETYNDGCVNCHGEFTGARAVRGQEILFGNKHAMHNSTDGGMAADCALCHIGLNDDPMIGASDGTSSSPGIGCTGCHKAEGLRAHHTVSGISSCSSCHSGDATPEPENVPPLYYGTPDTLVDGACNAEATAGVNENWTVGDFIGLDNDGDGLYDTDDPDCEAAGPDPVAPIAKAGEDLVAVDRDNDGSESVALDASMSSDENDDIASYVWRENGEVIARGRKPTVDFGVGLHTVELTVEDETELSDTDKLKVRVFDQPVNLATAIRDANGNSSPDFALALLASGPGKFNAYLRDGADGSAIRKISLGATQLLLMTTLRDISGNGRDELAVLNSGDNDDVFVRLFDTGNRKQLRKIGFQKNKTPLVLLALNDRAGGLGGRAVAVVQVGADDTVQAQVKDAATGNKVKTLQFSKAFAPVGAAAVRDIDKSDVEEIAVFGVHSDGRVRAQLLDALSGEQVARQFFDERFPPVLVTTIPSINNNSTDELVVLGINDAGKVRAQVLDSKTGKQLAVVTFDKDYAPLAMSYVDHPDGAALAVLGENAAGKRRSRTKLLSSGETVGLVSFPGNFGADSFIVLEDVDGSEVPELIMSGETSAGSVRAVTKDAVSGTELYRVTLP